jgi:MFS family permease
VLRDRRFQRLLGVRVAGTTADGLLEAALTSFVLFSPTHQPTPAKILSAFVVLLLPYSVVGPFIGVLIDRWQRQRILLIATLFRALLVIGVAAIVGAGQSGVILGLVVLVSLGVGRFVSAALSASLPHVVDDGLLVPANAIAPTSGTLTSVLGGLIGVSISTLLGGSNAASVVIILVAALGHFVATLISRGIPRTELGPDALRRKTLFEVLRWLWSGLEHLWARPHALRAIARVTTHRVAFGGATLLVLLLTRNSFNAMGQSTHALGEFSIVIGFAGGGAFFGAVLTPMVVERIGVARWAQWVLAGSAFVVAASYIWAAHRPDSSLAMEAVLVGSTLIGFAGQCVKISSDTIVQTAVADSHRGRVFALYDMALNFGIIAGTALAAVTVPMSGRSPAFALAVGVLLLLGAAIPA